MYIQKALDHTICRRGDNTWVESRKELYFIDSMINDKSINVDSFLVGNFRNASNASTCDIAVGELVTSIIEHLGYVFNKENSCTLTGKF